MNRKHKAFIIGENQNNVIVKIIPRYSIWEVIYGLFFFPHRVIFKLKTTDSIGRALIFQLVFCMIPVLAFFLLHFSGLYKDATRLTNWSYEQLGDITIDNEKISFAKIRDDDYPFQARNGEVELVCEAEPQLLSNWLLAGCTAENFNKIDAKPKSIGPQLKPIFPYAILTSADSITIPKLNDTSSRAILLLWSNCKKVQLFVNLNRLITLLGNDSSMMSDQWLSTPIDLNLKNSYSWGLSELKSAILPTVIMTSLGAGLGLFLNIFIVSLINILLFSITGLVIKASIIGRSFKEIFTFYLYASLVPITITGAILAALSRNFYDFRTITNNFSITFLAMQLIYLIILIIMAKKDLLKQTIRSNKQ